MAFFRDLIHNNSVDVVRVDTPVVGGITPTLRIIALADAAGLPVSPHIYPEINIHLAAAFPNVVAVEMFSSRTELYQIDRFISSKPSLRVEPRLHRANRDSGLISTGNLCSATRFKGRKHVSPSTTDHRGR